MAVHKNRYLADNQFIAAVGVIQNANGNHFLLAETLNPQHYQENEKPPLLMLAVVDSDKAASGLGYLASTAQESIKNIAQLAKGKDINKVEYLNKFLENNKSVTKNEAVVASQFNPEKAAQSAKYFSAVTDKMNQAFGGSNPHENLKIMAKQMQNGLTGHVFKMSGLVATSPSNQQNVYDGFEVDMPDPMNPSKTIKREVVTGFVLGLEPVLMPQQSVESKRILQPNESLYLDGSDQRVSLTTRRVKVENVDLIRGEDMAFPETNYAKPDDYKDKTAAIYKQISRADMDKKIHSIAFDLSVKQETILAASNIPTITDPDPHKRQTGLHNFHENLYEAIVDYNKIRHEGDGRTFKESGLVLEVWSKTPTDPGKDGVRNGYKNHAGFGMGVDLTTVLTADDLRSDKDAAGLATLKKLEEIVSLKDQATLDYLGERVEQTDSKNPPTFKKGTSKHHKLGQHLGELVKSELDAIQHNLAKYLDEQQEKDAMNSRDVELKMALDDYVSGPNKSSTTFSLIIANSLRQSPELQDVLLSDANLSSSMSANIQRTVDAMVDIEKKYASVTGLRSVLLANRTSNEYDSDIILNPDDPKLGSIKTPEWFNLAKMNDGYFKEVLLPTRSFTSVYQTNNPNQPYQKFVVEDVPMGRSLYGEFIKDMAEIRHDNLQTPELQKQRILTNPTFQINTVVRREDVLGKTLSQYYNGEQNKDIDTPEIKDLLKQFSLESKSKQFQHLNRMNARGLQLMTYNMHQEQDLQNRLDTKVDGDLRLKDDKPIFKATNMTVKDRKIFPNLGYNFNNPIHAYKPFFQKDGFAHEADNSVGSFSNLEGQKIYNFAPAIAVQDVGGRQVTFAQIENKNPLAKVDRINENLKNSADSVSFAINNNMPALQRLQEISVYAASPLFKKDDFVHAFWKMNSNKHDLSHAKSLDEYQNSNQRDWQAQQDYNQPFVQKQQEQAAPQFNQQDLQAVQKVAVEANGLMTIQSFSDFKNSIDSNNAPKPDEVQKVEPVAPPQNNDYDHGLDM